MTDAKQGGYTAHISMGATPRAFITPRRPGGVPKRVGAIVRDADTWAIQIPDTLTTLDPDTLRQLADVLEAWTNSKES